MPNLITSLLNEIGGVASNVLDELTQQRPSHNQFAAGPYPYQSPSHPMLAGLPRLGPQGYLYPGPPGFHPSAPPVPGNWSGPQPGLSTGFPQQPMYGASRLNDMDNHAPVLPQPASGLAPGHSHDGPGRRTRSPQLSQSGMESQFINEIAGSLGKTQKKEKLESIDAERRVMLSMANEVYDGTENAGNWPPPRSSDPRGHSDLQKKWHALCQDELSKHQWREGPYRVRYDRKSFQDAMNEKWRSAALDIATGSTEASPEESKARGPGSVSHKLHIKYPDWTYTDTDAYQDGHTFVDHTLPQSIRHQVERGRTDNIEELIVKHNLDFDQTKELHSIAAKYELNNGTQIKDVTEKYDLLTPEDLVKIEFTSRIDKERARIEKEQPRGEDAVRKDFSSGRSIMDVAANYPDISSERLYELYEEIRGNGWPQA